MSARSLSLSARVWAPTIAFCCLMGLLGVVMVVRASAMVHASTAEIDRTDHRVVAALELQTALHELPAAAAALAAAPAQATRFQPRVAAAAERVTAAVAELTRLADAPLRADTDRLAAAARALREAAVAGVDGTTADAAAREQVAAYVKAVRAAQDTLRADVAQARLGITHAVFVLALVIIAGALLATQFLVRTLVRPVRELVAFAQRLAARDLAHDVARTRGDELGDLQQALSAMRGDLVEMVRSARDGADQVQTAAGEIAAGNLDLSQRTEAAATHVQQTGAVLGELGDTVRGTAERARQADALAREAAEAAAAGGRVVNDVVRTMGEIEAGSRRIADIIGVIDGIAFQTNILALNAAVEASRAGEQGRGFAVVAGEVRLLAQRSADAAREIKSLIQESVGRVESGTKLVGEAGGSIGALVERVRHVGTVIAEITEGNAGQVQRLDGVAHAMSELDRVAQSNAALVEQGAAAAESLRLQAEALHRLVSGYRVSAVA